MKPIKSVKIPILSALRHVYPESKATISQNTFNALKKRLIESDSNILESENGNLYILLPKNEKQPVNYTIRVRYEILLQLQVEQIGKALNSGTFAHCYYDPELTAPQIHQISFCFGKAFVCLVQNIGKRKSYKWNYNLI